MDKVYFALKKVWNNSKSIASSLFAPLRNKSSQLFKTIFDTLVILFSVITLTITVILLIIFGALTLIYPTNKVNYV